MENLKAKSFDLRKDTDRYSDEPVFLPDEHFSGKHG